MINVSTVLQLGQTNRLCKNSTTPPADAGWLPQRWARVWYLGVHGAHGWKPWKNAGESHDLLWLKRVKTMKKWVFMKTHLEFFRDDVMIIGIWYWKMGFNSSKWGPVASELGLKKDFDRFSQETCAFYRFWLEKTLIYIGKYIII